jgi:hypothetical protein
MLPDDERDEVTDEDFLKHLVTPDPLGVNDRKSGSIQTMRT